MGLSNYQQIFTINIAKLILYAESLGIELTFGDAYRSNSQMLLNYYGKKVVHKGRELFFADSKKVSWTLKSKHAKRLAVDFNFFINEKYTNTGEQIDILGAYWISLHTDNRWGGDFKNKDKPHFEMNV